MTHRLYRKTAVLGLLAPLALLAACNKAATPAPEAPAERIATVNGKPVPKSEFELYVDSMSRPAGVQVSAEQKAEMLDQYIKMQLAADEAMKEGVEKDPKVRDQLALARQQVLLRAGMQKYLDSHPVQDSELRPEYDRQVAALPREYHARHILVDDQAAAVAITKQLQGGADFARLAAKRSKDDSRKNGGDLGWFTLENMVKPFSDAVRTLAPGELTREPVHSEFGWHVIKLEESRPSSAPPFEDVKDRVKTYVQQKKLQEHLDELVKAAKIEKTGAAPAATPAADAAKTEDKKESG